MNILDSVPLTALAYAMCLLAYFILLQFEELVSRGWKQRLASAVLLVLVLLFFGTAVKAAYIDGSDHYYYCLAWSWWPWSGC